MRRRMAEEAGKPRGPARCLWGLACEDRGQATVELMVVMPLMIVVALAVVNLMAFMGASARFDRVAPDAVIACAVSPSGADAETGDQSGQIAANIESAMGQMRGVTVEVRSQNAWQGTQEEAGYLGFSFAPNLTRYVCTLHFATWPSSISIAGIEAGLPLVLDHSCSLVVDRYRAGVLF